jgi:hypothetical protein
MLKRKIKMLYLSCHSVEEYDEIKLFHEMGIDVFSHGAYVDPRHPGDNMRPPLDWDPDPELVAMAKRWEKENLSKEFVDKFDIVFVMHIPRWISYNWPVMKHKIVIWRTTGQSTVDVETELAPFRAQGMKIVRYSPTEKTIPGYLGGDAMIRFYKDPDEFKDWNGVIPRVITLGQSMVKRSAFCGWNIFNQATLGFMRKLYGPHNEEAGEDNGGFLTYDRLKWALRYNRCYFYTGTYPANYTLNFIEAFMTGIPIVAIGPIFGNAPFLPGQCTYEIPSIIQNGVNGFWSDSIDQLREMVKLLLDRRDVAQEISKNARKTAVELFGKETIKKQWEEFFNSL